MTSYWLQAGCAAFFDFAIPMISDAAASIVDTAAQIPPMAIQNPSGNEVMSSEFAENVQVPSANNTEWNKLKKLSNENAAKHPMMAMSARVMIPDHLSDVVTTFVPSIRNPTIIRKAAIRARLNAGIISLDDTLCTSSRCDICSSVMEYSSGAVAISSADDSAYGVPASSFMVRMLS